LGVIAGQGKFVTAAWRKFADLYRKVAPDWNLIKSWMEKFKEIKPVKYPRSGCTKSVRKM
jgi:hypothetical protein